jgi:hypothetical protein
MTVTPYADLVGVDRQVHDDDVGSERSHKADES